MNPQPKMKIVRDRKLLDLAHEVHECQFQTPVCTGYMPHGCEPAHSNEMAHGKGKGQKASDDQHVASCRACHQFYDGGRLPKPELKRLFAVGRDRTFALYEAQGLLKKIGYTNGA